MSEVQQGEALDAQEVIDDLVTDHGVQVAAWTKERAMLRATVRTLTKQRDDALKAAREARVGGGEE